MEWKRRIASFSVEQPNPLKSALLLSPSRMKIGKPDQCRTEYNGKKNAQNHIKLYLQTVHCMSYFVYQCIKSKSSVFCMRRKIHAGIFGILYERSGENNGILKEKAQAIRDQTMLSPSSYHDFRRHCRRRACVRFSLSFRFVYK